MANNPLYPGYDPNPKQDNLNPVYPGYFPGQPQPRISKAANIKPSEFNFDQILGLISAVQADYALAGENMPRWVADRIVDDWKQNMKVTIKSADVQAEDLDDYDPNSLPGAFGISLNINPLDWIEDPQKTAQKTIQSCVKAGANCKDLETRFRRQVWNETLSENVKNDSPFQQLAATALGANIGASVGLSYSEGSNPLHLYGRNIFADDPTQKTGEARYQVHTDPAGNVTLVNRGRMERAKVDVMADFANSLADFEVMSSFGPKRDEARDKTAYKGYRAVVTELEKSPAVAATVAADPKLGRAFASAKTQLNVYDQMTAIGESLDDHAKYLTEAAFKGGTIDATSVTKTVDGIKDRLNAIDAQVAALASAPGMQKEAEYLKKYTQPFRQKVEKLIESPALDPAKAATTNPVVAVNLFKGQMAGGFTGTDIKKGIPRTMLRNMEADLTRPGLRGEISLGSAVKEIAQKHTDLASQVVVGGLTFTRNTGDINGAMDVMNALADGKFTERYVWPRVKSYWQASTPGAYTERFLKGQHYFGLNLADSSDAAFEKSVLNKVATGMDRITHRSDPAGIIGSGLAPNRTYGNWFRISSQDVAPASRSALNGVRFSANVYGGSHFKAVGTLGRFVDANDWANNPTAFNRLLQVNSINDLHGLNIKLPKGFKDDDWQKFIDEMKEFKQWVKDNKGRININIPETDEKYMFAIFTALKGKSDNKDFTLALSITRRYAGSMQKLAYKLNAMQSFVYKKVGKYIAPLAMAKKAVADAISAAISKAIALAGSGASGGTLAPIMAIIEPAIRFIVQITLDKVTEIAGIMYKAIVHADIDSVFVYVDKTVDRAAKVMLVGLSIFTFIFIAPAQRFLGTVATTVSPVDNSIGKGFGDDFSPSLGSGVEIKPLASRPSSSGGCFSFEDYNATIDIAGNIFALLKWEGSWQSTMEESITELKAVSGGYLERLCAKTERGPITLAWAQGGQGGYCGFATALNSNFQGQDGIIFGHGNCWTGHEHAKFYYYYLFAHETGHIYDFRNGKETYNGIGFSSVTGGGEGSFRTYPGNCSSSLGDSEDFAETVGNWVRINTVNCPDVITDIDPKTQPDAYQDAFWHREFPKHFEYADKVLFRAN